MSRDPNDFFSKVAMVKTFVQTKVKTIVKVEGVKHFKKSFRDEGFTDVALDKWPDISEARKKQKRKADGNLPPILTDTGELGNSITGTEDSQGVTFSTDKPYAQRHNEGLAGMPQRQFMGKSKVLEHKIINEITKNLNRILK